MIFKKIFPDIEQSLKRVWPSIQQLKDPKASCYFNSLCLEVVSLRNGGRLKFKAINANLPDPARKGRFVFFLTMCSYFPQQRLSKTFLHSS